MRGDLGRDSGAHDERDRLAALAADPRPDLPQAQLPEEPPHPGHTRYHIRLVGHTTTPSLPPSHTHTERYREMYFHRIHTTGDADIQFLQEVASNFPAFAVDYHPAIHCAGRQAHRGTVRYIPGGQHGHRAGPELLHTAQERLGCVYVCVCIYVGMW